MRSMVEGGRRPTRRLPAHPLHRRSGGPPPRPEEDSFHCPFVSSEVETLR